MMISVIIPTRDKAARLRLCLRALAEAARQSGVAREVIIVNDGSRDGTDDVALSARASFDIPFRLVKRNRPGGRAVARNEGAALATSERLLFLDDDILLSGTTLDRHYSAGEQSHPALARATILNLPWLRAVRDPARGEESLPSGLASRLLVTDGQQTLFELAKRHARRSTFEADLHRLLNSRPDPVKGGRWMAATGGNLSVPRDFFQTLNGFDERMGLNWGAEDLEFGYRAEKAGAVILHLADVVVHMDHQVADREAQHETALHYFSKKHGARLGECLISYFSGQLDILSVA